MAAALGLARRGLGRVWPNPAVGCVLVRDGRPVGRGWTQPGGRPHAETEALRRAGPEAARGATAYVTLEPCGHTGRTPPCAEALIAAGISRAVVAVADPDPRVAGRGLAALEQAGIAVEVGCLAAEARSLNAGFFRRIEHARPLVTVKLATSLDGRIATGSGESRWITGPLARARGHLMRAEHDAILVGAGTARADDPELTCRLPGLAAASPVRVVVDSRLRLALTGRLATGARRHPLWLITAAADERGARERHKAFQACGAEVIEVGRAASGWVDMRAAVAELGRRGITRLLVEGGARMVASLIAADLVDRLAWFRAAIVIGGDGRPAAEAFGLDALAEAKAFRRVNLEPVGEDVLETYERAA